MKTIKLFGNKPDSEPRVWWHWQNLSKEDSTGAFAKHGRAHLHFPGNSLGIEWSLFSRRCALEIEFSSVGDDAILFSIGIPFVASLYLSADRADWIKHLPGVAWTGKYESGQRELGLRVFDRALWWRLWRNPHIATRETGATVASILTTSFWAATSTANRPTMFTKRTLSCPKALTP